MITERRKKVVTYEYISNKESFPTRGIFIQKQERYNLQLAMKKVVK